MDTFNFIVNFVGGFDFGIFYPLYVSCSSLVVATLVLFLTLFVDKIKKTDKTIIPIFSLLSYFACGFKLMCDFLCGKNPDLYVLCFSVFISCVSLCFYVVSFLLSKDNSNRYMPDKRLIDQLMQYSGMENHADYPHFENRRESLYLPTDKLFTPKNLDDFGINYSNLLYIIRDLKQKVTDFEEEQLLSNLECDVIRLSHVKIANSERAIFSENLSRLLKLMSKYT